jgi:hypothetical protein
VEALVSGDPARADAAMRAHVRYGLPEVARHICALEAPEWRERRRREAAPAGPPLATPTSEPST